MADRAPQLGREVAREARSMRAAVASLRAAAEALDSFPDMEAVQRARLVRVLADEAGRLGENIDRLERLAAAAEHAADGRRLTTAGELLAAVQRAAEEQGLACDVAEPTDAVVEVALAPLTAAAAAFCAALRRDLLATRCRLRVQPEARHLLLDLVWSPEPQDLPRLYGWQGEVLDPAPGSGAPGLRAVARDHDGEAWFNLDREGATAYVRVLLPRAATETGAEG